MSLRTFFAIAISALMGLAQAQNYPSKTITLVTPFPPGGTTDGVARPLAQHLQKGLLQSVIVENRSGAGGSMGTATVARGPADGHTALIVFDTHAVNPHIYKKLGFDIFKDLKGVGQIVSMPMMLVAHPSLPVSNVAELVALAKTKPNTLGYASAGSGSSNHLATELLSRAAGIQLTHVPYRGGGPAISDLLAGHVQLMVVSQPLVLGHIRAGKLKALAVMGHSRSAAMPELRTVAEQGYAEIDVSSWIGMVVPAATPNVAVRRLHEELEKIARSKEFRDQMVTGGFNVAVTGPAEFDAYIKREYERWGPIVRDLRLTAD